MVFSIQTSHLKLCHVWHNHGGTFCTNGSFDIDIGQHILGRHVAELAGSSLGAGKRVVVCEGFSDERFDAYNFSGRAMTVSGAHFMSRWARQVSRSCLQHESLLMSTKANFFTSFPVLLSKQGTPSERLRRRAVLKRTRTCGIAKSKEEMSSARMSLRRGRHHKSQMARTTTSTQSLSQCLA